MYSIVLTLYIFQFGIRTQGIHDVLMPFLGPKGTRQKRSLDILNYIFGVSTEEEVYETRNQENGYQVRIIELQRSNWHVEIWKTLQADTQVSDCVIVFGECDIFYPS